MYLIEKSRNINLHTFQFEALERMKNIVEGIIHLPTGTGKSIIFMAHILEEMLTGPKVFVICTPRIILTNQMVKDLKIEDVRICVVHSGKKLKSKNNKIQNFSEYYDDETVDYSSDIRPTTTFKDIEKEYKLAKQEGQSLIIFSTYHSAHIFANKLNVDVLYCDEAHHLVNKEFNYLADEESNILNKKYFKANKKYYFTATLKTTVSKNGVGLNNEEKFGPKIISKTPKDAIDLGLILPSIIHVAELQLSNKSYKKEEREGHMVYESFLKHQQVIATNQNKINAKMLVICSDTESLEKTRQYLENHKDHDVKIMSITSKDGAIINNKKVEREEFLTELSTLKDDEKVIILHVRILTEGIDVTGITGINFLHIPDNISSFLQNLGRGTRLYKTDRENLKNGSLKVGEIDKFIKPYVYVIIPIIDANDIDKDAKIKDIIGKMREGEHLNESDIVITDVKGNTTYITENILDENSFQFKTKKCIESIQHEIETKINIENEILEDYNHQQELKNMSNDEFINSFYDLF